MFSQLKVKRWVWGVLVGMLLVSSLAQATSIRGRVDGVNAYSQMPYPLGGAVVDLYRLSPAGWQSVGKYITGGDGMYYFRNIQPGRYAIQINGRQNYPVVILPQPYQDLPPVRIRY